MTNSAEPTGTPAPTESQPVTASAPVNSASQPSSGGLADEHPEALVGAAFAGGLLLATILKRIAD